MRNERYERQFLGRESVTSRGASPRQIVSERYLNHILSASADWGKLGA
jgi:hypothetical protein